jgi:hypothetical protein
MHDPLGIHGGLPLVPPWAVPFGLQPPYPGGSFDEYLDPGSRYYRPDVVAALREQQRRAVEVRRAEDAARERAVGLHRERLAAVEAAKDPHELARAVVGLGDRCDPAQVWDAWSRAMGAGIYPSTHDLVRLKIQAPLRGPRFKELERRPAWRDGDRDRYFDADGRVWVKGGGQPVRGPRDPWFAVPAGAGVQAEVFSAKSTGRFTMISANPLVEADPDDYWGCVLGALARFVDG